MVKFTNEIAKRCARWILLETSPAPLPMLHPVRDDMAAAADEIDRLQKLIPTEPQTPAWRPAAPVETETRFHTDEDREYARGLLEDMDDEQSNAVDSRINIAAQWFCKARVETARRVAKQVRPESASREAVLEAQGTIEQLEKQLAFERKKSEPSFLHAGSPLWRIDLLCEQHELYTKDELVGLIQKVVQDDFCSRAQRIANDMG